MRRIGILRRASARVDACAHRSRASWRWCPAAALAQTRALEHAVKASYLFKFAPFVEWPDRAFDSPSRRRWCCAWWEPTPSTELVDDAARTASRVRGGALSVRARPAERGARREVPHAVRGPGRERRRARSTGARGTPVLTITDVAAESRAERHRQLRRRDNRVRFEIDLADGRRQRPRRSAPSCSISRSGSGRGHAN